MEYPFYTFSLTKQVAKKTGLPEYLQNLSNCPSYFMFIKYLG